MRTIFVFLFVVLALSVIYGVFHDRQLDAKLAGIIPQEPESAVIQALGTPSALTSPCEAYGTAITTGDCDHVMVYKSFFNALHPKYWLVFIDNKGMTTATARQNIP